MSLVTGSNQSQQILWIIDHRQLYFTGPHLLPCFRTVPPPGLKHPGDLISKINPEKTLACNNEWNFVLIFSFFFFN